MNRIYSRGEFLKIGEKCLKPPDLPDFSKLLIRRQPRKKRRPKEDFVDIYHVNINGIMADGKFDAIKEIMQLSPNTIFGISESKLTSSCPSHLVQIDGFKMFRKDRNGKGGGGTLLYIPEHFFIEKPHAIPNHLEIIAIPVRFGSKELLIAVIYRAPKVDAEETKEIICLLDEIVAKSPEKDIVIMGDLNIDLSERSSSPYLNQLKFFCDAHGLVDRIPNETRVKRNQQKEGGFRTTISKIDVLLCRPGQNYSAIPAEDVPFSDHRLCQTRTRFKCPTPLHRTVRFRVWNTENDEAFLSSLELRVMEFSTYVDSPNPSHDMSCLIRYLLELIDLHYPLRTKRVRKEKDPWITTKVRKLFNQRNHAYKRMKASTDDEYLEARTEFCDLKKKAGEAVTESRRQFFERISSDKRRLWQAFGHIINRKSSITSVECNVSELNRHFIEMGTHGHQLSDEEQPINDIPSTATSSFDLESVQPPVISKLLRDLAAKKKSIGPYGIPNQLLKKIAPIIDVPLTNIINNCITRGVYPDIFKAATVIPLPKVSTPQSNDDYRPISLLCNISKVFEKVVQQQLVKHLKTVGLLSDRQSGFRNGHSCETLLLKVTENWRKAIDKKEVVAVAFLDLKKAFDSVHHGRLLEILRDDVGCRRQTLELFTSYLRNRTQCVSSMGQRSATDVIVSGVPQGTVLGPILFTIFINRLLVATEGSEHGTVECFADDTAVFSTGKNAVEATAKLNALLEKVSQWFSNNFMVLNEKKCVSMLMTTPQRRRKLENVTVKLNGLPLQMVNSTKYLGVVIDHHLDWKEQISKVEC